MIEPTLLNFVGVFPRYITAIGVRVCACLSENMTVVDAGYVVMKVDECAVILSYEFCALE